MIDLRAARADPDAYRAALERRGAGEAFDELLAADERWRALVPQVDELRAQQKMDGKPSPEQIEELRGVKERLRALEDDLSAAEAARDAALAKVPNPPHESAADGMTEDDAVEIKRWGEHPKLADPKEHTEIGRFELARAAKISGSRFGFLAGDTALMALALYRLALDRLVAEGFTPMIPPVLVREEAMYGTGFFPSDKSDYYAVPEDGLYLVGTSEVPLIGMHMDEILDELPIHYCAFSSCFRRESGAAGRDTRGLFRVHQFQKVEMVVYTRPEDSWGMHERMLAIEESLVQAVELPYRVVNTAAGDLSAAAAQRT
jgi:seryl-tRNA synthetase